MSDTASPEENKAEENKADVKKAPAAAKKPAAKSAAVKTAVAEKPAPAEKVADAADQPAVAAKPDVVEKAVAPAAKADASGEEKPAAPAAKPVAEKPAEPVEPAFAVDVLINCTSRFTHKAWYLFYNNQKDMTFIRETPVRATLECRTTAGAEEIHRTLVDEGVQQISRHEKVISFTATFETIQKVIKHPQSYMLDAIKI